MLNAMAGHDPRDATSLDRPREDYTRDLGKPLAGLRVGMPDEYFGDGVDPDVAAAVGRALGEFRKLGATTVRVRLPNVKLSVPVYYVIAPAERSPPCVPRTDSGRPHSSWRQAPTTWQMPVSWWDASACKKLVGRPARPASGSSSRAPALTTWCAGSCSASITRSSSRIAWMNRPTGP
jgi:Asp-tRNA(Asn)/Glu-tRNA(Gln) amidotransferase A subunit family amidase